MNIATPIPNAVSFITANVNTEAARRDNTLRETVPAPTALENSAAQSGQGSGADRVKTPGQPPPPLTYERQQPSQGQQGGGQNSFEKDNAEDQSAGKENAESRQQEQQAQAQQKEIQDFKQRDLEVRSHEKAHASIGGRYSGTPQYQYQTGPDGQRYAVGGEVSIDISSESTPEATIRKMQQVKAAALSPAEPSQQDLRVATEATQKAVAAHNEIIHEKEQKAEQAFNAFRSDPSGQRNSTNLVPPEPELDEIINANDFGLPTRSLDHPHLAEALVLQTDSEEFKQVLASRDEKTIQRVSVIKNFYQQISLAKTADFSQQV